MEWKLFNEGSDYNNQEDVTCFYKSLYDYCELSFIRFTRHNIN